nr:zinc finger BED domain-containing protein RICESLEEPER 2-like [Ipomoea batatas]
MVHGLIRRSCLAGKKQEADDGDVNREDERLVFLFAMRNEKPVKEEAGMSTGNSSVPQNPNTLNSVVGESNETINEVNEQAGLDGHDTPLNEEIVTQEEFQTTKRKKTSGVWVDFEVVNVAGTQKVECIHCRHRFAFNKTGTTTSYKRHQDKCAMRKKTMQVVDNQTKLNFLPSDGVSSSIPPLHHGRVDMEVVRESIANWIMMHEHPTPESKLFYFVLNIYLAFFTYLILCLFFLSNIILF